MKILEIESVQILILVYIMIKMAVPIDIINPTFDFVGYILIVMIIISLIIELKRNK